MCRRVMMILVCCVLLTVLSANISFASPLNFIVYPQFLIPLGLTVPDGPELYGPGGGARLGMYYSLSRPGGFLIGGDLGVDVVSTEDAGSALTMISLNAVTGYRIGMGEVLALTPTVSVGYTQSLFGGSTAGQLSAGADLLLDWRLSPGFTLSAGAGYVNRIGLYEGIRIFLGTSFSLGRGTRDSFSPTEIRIDPLFPVLYQYYESGSFGKVSLENKGTETLRDVELSVFINQYMDAAQILTRFSRVERGETLDTDLTALFNNQMLKLYEGDRVTAQILVGYSVMGERFTQSFGVPVQINYSNALTWDDDRKAAAFVTARDPNILRYARNTVNVQDETPLKAINGNFRAAMALFESLPIYGISYFVDPMSSYEELSKDAMALDFIQFPIQSLGSRGGDCDDLSILYNALLEAVPIETAFITTPGHIYSAFNLDMWPAEAERTFGSLDNLIVRDNTVWVPVEVTALRQGFQNAWDIGVRQWREHSAAGDANIVLTRQAWQVYPSVGSPGDGFSLTTLPDRNRLLSSYERSLENFITRSIFSREQELLARITSSGDQRAVNTLGVLYARHGLLDKAEQQFERIALISASARVNLGNIAMLQEDYRSALENFEAALGMQPGNNVALLGTALARHNLNDYTGSADAYVRLAESNKGLAVRYSWLAGGSDTGTARASGAGEETRLIWDE